MTAISSILIVSILAVLGSVHSASFRGVADQLSRPLPQRLRMGQTKPARAMAKRSGAAAAVMGPSSAATSAEGSADKDGGFLMIAEAPPKLLEARQHGKTVLECSASGNPAPQITWFKDGQPLIREYSRNSLLDGDYGEFALESLSETKSKISLDCVSESDAGLYECVAHTNSQKTSVATEVHVVSFAPNGCTPRHLFDFSSAPPVIYQWMGTYLQLIGTDAHLICRAEGHHTTQWRGPMDNVIKSGNKFTVLPNGDLIVRDLTFDDMGMYKCEAKNANGDDMKEVFVYPHAA